MPATKGDEQACLLSVGVKSRTIHHEVATRKGSLGRAYNPFTGAAAAPRTGSHGSRRYVAPGKAGVSLTSLGCAYELAGWQALAVRRNACSRIRLVVGHPVDLPNLPAGAATGNLVDTFE